MNDVGDGTDTTTPKPSSTEAFLTRPPMLLVAGMHRSGTSAISGVCERLGCKVLGEQVPAAVDNPKGFFENRRIVNFHDRLLESMGSSQDDPLLIGPDELKALIENGAGNELAAILLEEFGATPMTLVKDPRMARFLPIWVRALELCERQILVLLPLRHPIEVAGSLQKRNGYSQAHGLLLWLSHTLAAERDSRGLARSFTLYDALLDDWRSTLQKVSQDLEIRWPRSIGRTEDRIDEFLERSMRHHKATGMTAASSDALRALCSRAWTAMETLVREAGDPVSLASLDAVRAELDSAQTIFGPLVTSHHALLASTSQRVIDLEQHSAHMDYLLDQKQQLLEEAEQLRSEASRQAELHSADMNHLLDQQRRLLDEAEQLRTDASKQAEELQDQLTQAQTERARLGGLLDQSRSEITAFYNSTTWRVMAPVRRLSLAAPKDLRRAVRWIMKDGWGSATPWAVMQRLRARRAFLQGTEVTVPHGVDATEAERIATKIRASSLFDSESYDAIAGARANGQDPALHYVLFGEALGYAPSKKFNPAYYGERYPDLAESQINLLDHYISHGRDEGRIPLPSAATLEYPTRGIDHNRKTILVIAHETSRTGAPILAWNLVRAFRKRGANVVVLLMRGGPLTQAFKDEATAVVGPIGDLHYGNATEAKYVVEALIDAYDIDYVLANSVETRNFAAEFARRLVPVVALVHEFSSYYRPRGMLHDLYATANRIVFSAGLVRDVSVSEYDILQRRELFVLPQGPSIVPSSKGGSESHNHPAATAVSKSVAEPKLSERELLLKRLRPEGAEGAFLVVGMGTVQHRKGVDLFIAAAAAARRLAPYHQLRFVWIGHGYEPSTDLQYSVYLEAQIELSRMGEHLEIIENVSDVEPIYEEMDVLMLTSRLDPLPNVSIDAALRGVPVVCFEDASGMAELLAENSSTRELVVPHLDTGAAGQVVADLAIDQDRQDRVSAAIRRFAEAKFDMDQYVASLDELGVAAALEVDQIKEDKQELLADHVFDEVFYRGEVLPGDSKAAAINHYLLQSSQRSAKLPSIPHMYPRRPAPGFHPSIYATECPSYLDSSGDPLVHYLKMGKPAGRWAHEVVRPKSVSPLRRSSPALRVAIHGHFYYAELAYSFLEHLEANSLSCDLFLTTTDKRSAEILERACAGFRKGSVSIRVVPNVGRDIAPFLVELGPQLLEAYDVVGHLHGKRSVHTQAVDATYGDRWREFLWQHLIGDKFPMADIAIDRFAQDPELGLLFPEDPNLVAWDQSRDLANKLKTKLGIERPLPDHFDFPIGTMFWARTKAIAPLFELGLSWEQYPKEPLPEDGTTLHAIERLIPFVVEESGYTYATTHVQEFLR